MRTSPTKSVEGGPSQRIWIFESEDHYWPFTLNQKNTMELGRFKDIFGTCCKKTWGNNPT